MGTRASDAGAPVARGLSGRAPRIPPGTFAVGWNIDDASSAPPVDLDGYVPKPGQYPHEEIESQPAYTPGGAAAGSKSDLGHGRPVEDYAGARIGLQWWTTEFNLHLGLSLTTTRATLAVPTAARGQVAETTIAIQRRLCATSCHCSWKPIRTVHHAVTLRARTILSLPRSGRGERLRVTLAVPSFTHNGVRYLAASVTGVVL
jgi:hypothetical protein